MPITDSDTVIVLGAGVSAPFGLSLGASMIDQIHSDLDGELRSLGSDPIPQLSAVIGPGRYFWDRPILCTIAHRVVQNHPGLRQSEHLAAMLVNLGHLRDLLDDQASETIDDFIVENPAYAAETKICIASSFLKKCYSLTSDNRIVLNQLSGRYYPPSPLPDTRTTQYRNWIHLLINIVRQGIRNGTVSAENKIKIVTFNYDKILEHVLEKQFGNTEKGYGRYQEYVDISHVHGECGDLVEELTDPAKACLEWSAGISVVNEPSETIPAGLIERRAEIKKLVSETSSIYFDGFSFSGPNCRLLGLNQPNTPGSVRSFFYCNYDGNVGLTNAVQNYRLVRHSQRDYDVTANIFPDEGTSAKPLDMVDWLRSGRLGELSG